MCGAGDTGNRARVGQQQGVAHMRHGRHGARACHQGASVAGGKGRRADIRGRRGRADPRQGRAFLDQRGHGQRSQADEPGELLLRFLLQHAGPRRMFHQLADGGGVPAADRGLLDRLDAAGPDKPVRQPVHPGEQRTQRPDIGA